MINKNYILVTSEKVENKYTINRYYFVSNGEYKKIEGSDLKILKSILSSYTYDTPTNNSKIFTQYDEIKKKFDEETNKEINTKEKLKQVKNKKVNRIKSKSIRVVALGLSIVLLGNLAVALGGKKNTKDSNKSNDTTITSAINNSNNDSNKNEKIIITDEEIDTILENIGEYYDEPTTSIEIDTNTTTENNDNSNIANSDNNNNIENEDNTLIFEYESDVSIDDQSLENALRYKDLFIKYGNQYGVPWQLLCAIAAQENGGVHDADYSDPALGIMQIERDALINHTFKKVYNHNTNSIESFTVRNANSELEGLKYNIKCGAIQISDGLRVAYNVAVKEGKISIEDAMAYGIQRYNFGGGNLSKTLNMGGYWMDNRDYISSGDSRYLERILDGVKKLGLDSLTIKYYDEEQGQVREVITKFINTYTNKLKR